MGVTGTKIGGVRKSNFTKRFSQKSPNGSRLIFLVTKLVSTLGLLMSKTGSTSWSSSMGTSVTKEY